MGYDVHITRREHWADADEPDITINEWLNYATEDKELELTNGQEMAITSDTPFQNSPGLCTWIAHPTKRDPEHRPWFAYWNGSIEAKNPDFPTIRKMILIAVALDAEVQGDDGEHYTDEYLRELHTQKELIENQVDSESLNKKPRWKLW
jgi:hypothetical protein